MTISLNLQGTLTFLDGDHAVTGVRSRKAIALLAYLALNEGAIERLTLADLFWPDQTEKRARANLSWVLNRLKKVLPPCLETARHTVQLQRHPDFRVDVWELDGDFLPLLRGDLLDGFLLDDCPQFERWLLTAREHWRQQIVRRLTAAIDAHIGHADYAAALPFAEKWVQIMLWHEEGHRQLMRCLAGLGDREGALLQFERCKRLLREELGVAPSAETVALYEQIRTTRQHDPTHNLPRQWLPFFGRSSLLSQLTTQLPPFTTVIGYGGIGKTRLAIEIGYRALANFVDGVCFVTLADRMPSADPAGTLSALVATARGLTLDGNDSPTEALIKQLRDKHLLLIIDNFEGWEAATPWLIQLLQGIRALSLIVTSRQRLPVTSAQVILLEGLTYPQSADSNWQTLCRDYSALALFADAVARHDPHAALLQNAAVLSSAQRATVQLVQRLQGLPLGLILAAPLLVRISAETLTTQLSNDLDKLDPAVVDLAQRHRTLRAVFTHSWQLLSASAQALLAQLAIFRGGFTLAAAQAIMPVAARDLQTLQDHQLIMRDTTGRYQMHPLVRQYARERLPDPATLAAAHADYFSDWLHLKSADLRSARMPKILAQLQREQANLFAAWEVALTQRDSIMIDAMLNGLYLMFGIGGQYRLGLQLFSDAQTIAQADRLLVSRLQVRAAIFTQVCGRQSEAFATLDAAIPTLRAAAHSADLALALRYRARVAMRIGRRDQAIRDTQESLDLFTKSGERHHIAGLHDQLNALYAEQGDLASALAHARNAVAITTEISNVGGLPVLKNHLANILIKLQRYDEAERHLQETLPLAVQLGMLTEQAFTYYHLAEVAVGRGALDSAEKHLAQARLLLRDSADQQTIAHTEQLAGIIATARADFPRAHDHLQRARTLYRELDIPYEVALTQHHLIPVLIGLNRPNAAQTLAREVAAAAIENDWPLLV